MKHCVWGLGWKRRMCSRDATTKREGWPMCEEHGTEWDKWVEQEKEAAGVVSVG